MRAFIAVLSLFVATTALAGGHKVIKPMVPIPVDAEVDAGVRATLAATQEAWTSQDFAKILDLWDPNEEYPTYIAEEQAQWFVGWDRLRDTLIRRARIRQSRRCDWTITIFR